MYQAANILPSLRSASLALTSVLLVFSHFGAQAPAHAALSVLDGYSAIPGTRIPDTAADKVATLIRGEARGPSNRIQLNPHSIRGPGSILASRNSSNRIDTPRNPSFELYQKRRISPPVSPRRPDIDLIKPQERIQPPDYRRQLNRKRNNRIVPPSRLGRDPLGSNIDCRGGIIRQGNCHCRGTDVLREVAGNVYACVTRPLEQP